jgi:ATP-dependent exoDNAse (exonuclease V) alpha subunit
MTQKEALEILKSGASVFLTGEPGAGKTHTLNLFKEWAFVQGKACVVTASTGIASTHIGGSTIHSFSGIGIKSVITASDLRKIYDNNFKYRDLVEVDILVVDEVSMIDANFINLLDYVLKEIRKNSKPFGGVQVVFVGDFFQLPPVVKEGETRFAFEADAWGDAELEVCYLTEQHRSSERVFIDILRRMRAGNTTKNDIEVLSNSSSSTTPELNLFTHNADVDKLNEVELSKLEGEEWGNSCFQEGVPFLCQQIIRSMLSPFRLQLRLGAKVMFTKNNFEAGYVNGTIGTVTGFEGRDPVVSFDEGRQSVRVRRAEWVFEDKDGVQKAKVVQYPLRLAYAITVHKSQGMSIDSAFIDLSRVFEYGQGYVAVSRVRSLKGLKLKGATLESFKMHPKVVEYNQRIK